MGCSCFILYGGKRGPQWHQQELYTNTYVAMSHPAMEQLAENIRAFVTNWELHDMMAETRGEQTKLLKIPSCGQKYFSAEWTWFA